jgi:hypothetical protein
MGARVLLVVMVVVLVVGMWGSTIRAEELPAMPACTAAQHDRYQLDGPDGRRYAIWHPQFDVVQGCIHDHEHGSDPRQFVIGQFRSPTFVSGIWPLFGYSAAQAGMTEPHNGFKVFVFEWKRYRWMILHHFGTGNAAGAACVRHHTLDIWAYDILSRTLMLEHHGMGDFGAAVANETGQPLVPPSCPDQAQQAAGSSGVRQLPMANLRNIGYEPWRLDNRPIPTASGMFNPANLTIFTYANPQTACNDQSCATNVARTDLGGPARGTWRYLLISAGFGIPGVATVDTTIECYPMSPTDYTYQCDVPAVARASINDYPHRLNRWVTGNN